MVSCWAVGLYSVSTIKMNQAALESRSIQSLIDKTSIPEAKMYVGGVRSPQDKRLWSLLSACNRPFLRPMEILPLPTTLPP